MIAGAWMVEYEDGAFWTQYDDNGEERPYKSIDWPRAKRIYLESQHYRSVYDIHQPPEGYQLSLRGRGFIALSGDQLFIYMLVISKAGEEVNDESTESVLYWFPTGVEHICPHFNCPDVAKFACGSVHGQDVTLMPEHHVLQTAVDAQLD